MNIKSDIKRLELIYDQSKSTTTDFLLQEDISNFDWEKFWNYYIICEQNYYPLYESFESISRTENNDTYKVIATNGAEFLVYVNYLKPSDLDNRIINAYVSDLKDRNTIKELQHTLEKTKLPVLNVNFKDSEDNVKITGKLGNYSFSVMDGIKDSVGNSLYNRNEISPDVIYFIVKEKKKVEFFRKVFKNMFGKLDGLYVDDSNNGNFIVYFFNTNL